MKIDCQRDFRMEKSATTADVRGQKSGRKILICSFPLWHRGRFDLGRVCDLAGSATSSSNLSDLALPCKTTVQIFSEEIIKFQKLLGRETLYHLSSPPPSLILDLASVSGPVVLMLTCKKDSCYTEPLFKPSVFTERCIFTEPLLSPKFLCSCM